MLLVKLHAGETVFGVPARAIVEIIPGVPLEPVPRAPAHVAGLCAYRGALVPVVDLGVLLHGRPSPSSLGTRIAIVEYAGPAGPLALGLLAERVTDTVTLADGEPDEASPTAQATGLRHAEAPYLGRVARVDGELLHLLAVEAMVRAYLGDTLAPERMPAEAR